MIKKIFFTFLFLLVAFIGAASDIFLFDLVPADGPLYKEPLADPYSFSSKIHIQRAVDSDKRPVYIRTAVRVYDRENNRVDSQYIDLPYSQNVVDESGKYNTYLHMRLGTSASAFRFRLQKTDKFPSVDAEVSVGGALNTLFNIYSNSDALGFDGTWFAGINARIADRYVLRFGMHHFSGHYGDEILDRYYRTNEIDFSKEGLINADFAGKNPDYSYYFNNYMEYVRDNCWILGYSVDIFKGFRTYGEFELPWKTVWLRPFADAPYFCGSHSSYDHLIEYLGYNSEGFTENMVEKEMALKKNAPYYALRFHFGADYSFYIKNVGNIVAGFDLQMHQDGQTKHLANEYKKTNPWEYEFTAMAGLELGKVLTNKNITAEICYHNGRTSTVDFYYQRCNTVSIGLAIL